MFKGETNFANPGIVTLVPAFPELHGKYPHFTSRKISNEKVISFHFLITSPSTSAQTLPVCPINSPNRVDQIILAKQISF